MTRAAIVILALLGGWLLLGAPAHAGVEVGEPREVTPKQAHEDSTRGVVHRELGITVGTPAGVNLDAGYWFNPRYGVRASGLYLGSIWGVQGNLCISASRRAASRHSIALVAGTFHSSEQYMNYVGPAWNLNLNMFFIELGLVRVNSNFSNLQDRQFGIITQVGILGGGGVFGPR